MDAYHVTRERYLPSIIDQGLLGRDAAQARNFSHWAAPDGVYVFLSQVSYMRWTHCFDDAIVLRIPDVDRELVRMDAESIMELVSRRGAEALTAGAAWAIELDAILADYAISVSSPTTLYHCMSSRELHGLLDQLSSAAHAELREIARTALSYCLGMCLHAGSIDPGRIEARIDHQWVPLSQIAVAA